MQQIIYARVKLVVEVDNASILPDEVMDIVGSETDYTFSYDEDGIKIVDTEIVDIHYWQSPHNVIVYRGDGPVLRTCSNVQEALEEAADMVSLYD